MSQKDDDNVGESNNIGELKNLLNQLQVGDNSDGEEEESSGEEMDDENDEDYVE